MSTVAIIGGGISGLGIAAAAAKHGHQVILLERDRCGAGTSANSLRIIHGGFRYLQSLNLIRVVHSIRAQAELLAAYPDLIVALPCMLPLSERGLHSYSSLRVAGALYRATQHLASGRAAPVGVFTPAQVTVAAPEFAPHMPHGALHWTDGLLLDPAELVQREIARATTQGARIREGCCVTAVERVGVQWRVNYLTDDGAESAEADFVVNAAGPWINYKITKNFVELPDFAGMQWCLAFNVVVRRSLSSKWALGLRSRQGRLFFAVPRKLPDGQMGTAIGTGYLALEDGQSTPEVPSHELAAFIAQFNSVHAEASLVEGELVAVESGFLPIRRMTEKGPILFGAQRIRQKRGYIEVLSTKYTTYRNQADRVVSYIF